MAVNGGKGEDVMLFRVSTSVSVTDPIVLAGS